MRYRKRASQWPGIPILEATTLQPELLAMSLFLFNGGLSLSGWEYLTCMCFASIGAVRRRKGKCTSRQNWYMHVCSIQAQFKLNKPRWQNKLFTQKMMIMTTHAGGDGDAAADYNGDDSNAWYRINAEFLGSKVTNLHISRTPGNKYSDDHFEIKIHSLSTKSSSIIVTRTPSYKTVRRCYYV